MSNGGWGTAEARLAAKTDVRGPDECWPWMGYVATDGYGRIGSNWKVLKTHRLAYELARGPIPAGLVIDHTCHNGSGCTGKGRDCPHRRCLNPAHLEATTMRVNTLRGNQFPFGLDCCKRGHEFTPENTYVDATGRRCRTCKKLADARRRESKYTAGRESELTPPRQGRHRRSATPFWRSGRPATRGLSTEISPARAHPQQENARA